ncbi:MAG: hypothetical protein ACRC8S_18645 [Fimbriiglobus sp.]
MHYKLTLIAFLAALLIGCGGDTTTKPLDLGGQDGTAVATLVEDMNDAIGSPKKLTDLFVSGAKLPETAKLKGLAFTIVGKPTVNGATAECKVSIEKNSTAAGEQTWTFEKVADKWKIKAAPLP